MTNTHEARIFDRTEIIGRLRAVEAGEATLYERTLLADLSVARAQVERMRAALEKLANPVANTRTEEGWLVQSEVMQIASHALAAAVPDPEEDA